jgi:hypothetical protein
MENALALKKKGRAFSTFEKKTGLCALLKQENRCLNNVKDKTSIDMIENRP